MILDDLMNKPKPLIVQSDGSLLLEVMTEGYEQARDAILPFAELLKSPEYVHTYRITPLSVWNAAAGGLELEAIIAALEEYSRYALPRGVVQRIQEAWARYGAVTLERLDAERLLVRLRHAAIREELKAKPRIAELIVAEAEEGLLIAAETRGRFKHRLIKLGYPVSDLVGYEVGAPLELSLRQETLKGQAFGLRAYQQEAVEHFWAGGSAQGGQGVVVLSCGAGKTVVGLGVMARARTETLILCTNVAAVHQWKRELLDKTDLTEDQIGEYTGQKKEIRPVTLTTYQILTWRRSKTSPFEHMNLMRARAWGLLIYDEVHVLPAPVFSATTEIQAKRRLGLTATLIREDGLEGDTYSLVGPKCYDVPWRELEQKGFIATATCHEIRLPLPAKLEIDYANAGERAQYRLAAENPYKDQVVSELVQLHGDEQILIIGQYLDQLKRLSKALKAPLITGATSNAQRDELYQSFRDGAVGVLVVSKVANFAIDLPDASVAIQVSGTFGSRQEEAQRLGRILRPKTRPANFYSLVTTATVEEDFAQHRQVFLAEQGYRYEIEERSLDDFAD
ncbi:MAG: Type III restriction enzyme, res subunit [Deltaproteobacteria bacterium ADurb.Bin510]|nr:MAG: Type III restriction enzyme, res subunit [Deltaproteobacteria bacterium ADurb.Bin510]